MIKIIAETNCVTGETTLIEVEDGLEAETE